MGKVGNKASSGPKPAGPDVDDEEESLEEKKKKDLHPELPGDPTWTLEERMQVRKRLQDSGTPLGFPDLVFDAPALVEDSYRLAYSISTGLQEMMTIVTEAARKMRDEDWMRFQEIPGAYVHMDDSVVHGNFFSTKEPTWRPLMQKPKKTKTTCVFLHIGTEPPSNQLCDFLTKLGWMGVCIGPRAPPPGNEDLVQFTRIDPADARDQHNIDELMAPRGGLVPKPVHFGLTYVNVTFNPREESRVLDPYDEDYEEKIRLRAEHQERQLKEKEERAERKRQREKERQERLRAEMARPASRSSAGSSRAVSSESSVRPTSRGSKDHESESSASDGEAEDETWAKPMYENTPLPEPSPDTAMGYGKVGITRSERIRRRLRALRNSLAVAINRLANDGSLVVFWPGVTCHPVLFFIAGSFRRLFQRVHILTPEGSKTFDIYILASGFKRDKAEDQTPGLGGLELKSFFDSTWRTDTLDDVMHWTLLPPDEEEELNVGASGRGMIASYTELWKSFSDKFRALAMDMGVFLLSNGNDMKPPPALPVKKKALPDKKNAGTEGKKGSKDKKQDDKASSGASSKGPAATEQTKHPDQSPAKPVDDEPKKEEPAKKEEPPSVAALEKVEAKAEEPATAEAPAKPAKKSEPAKSAKSSADQAKKEEATQKVSDKTDQPKAQQSRRASAASAGKAGRKGNRDKTQKEKPDPLPTDIETKLMNIDDEGEPLPKKRFIMSRSLPSLSCSLGSSPGHKHKFPSYEEMAEQWRLIDTALEVAKVGRMRRWKVMDQPRLSTSFTLPPPDHARKSPAGSKSVGTSKSPGPSKSPGASKSRGASLTPVESALPH